VRFAIADQDVFNILSSFEKTVLEKLELGNEFDFLHVRSSDCWVSIRTPRWVIARQWMKRTYQTPRYLEVVAI
jgi:hypothetical protein